MRRTNDTHLLYPPAVVTGHHSLYPQKSCRSSTADEFPAGGGAAAALKGRSVEHRVEGFVVAGELLPRADRPQRRVAELSA